MRNSGGRWRSDSLAERGRPLDPQRIGLETHLYMDSHFTSLILTFLIYKEGTRILALLGYHEAKMI